ncbi:hypothetical protein CBM2589_A70301 [Cupriavidus taiwanensis]|uniref:Uncharacterized protein n=1 Tax=Cupriavidus taiwanensis TaxID=164546 RepID=A0A975XB35_9BURK|nr:hypothetical protein CBM2589_A70301 [Cupriavidus taiwanensis]
MLIQASLLAIVINNNNLNVPISLIRDSIKSLPQQLRAIRGRDDDRDHLVSP